MILRPRETRVVGRAPKWLLAVLVISLLINGLVAGAVASRWQAMHAGASCFACSNRAARSRAGRCAIATRKVTCRGVARSSVAWQVAHVARAAS